MGDREQREFDRLRDEREHDRRWYKGKLAKWNRDKRLARDGISSDDDRALDNDWATANPRGLVWTLFTLLETTGWAHLPDGGGWLEQDESLMQDMAELTRMSSLIMAHLEADAHDA